MSLKWFAKQPVDTGHQTIGTFFVGQAGHDEEKNILRSAFPLG